MYEVGNTCGTSCPRHLELVVLRLEDNYLLRVKCICGDCWTVGMGHSCSGIEVQSWN
jgi:hypothetical protein